MLSLYCLFQCMISIAQMSIPSPLGDASAKIKGCSLSLVLAIGEDDFRDYLDSYCRLGCQLPSLQAPGSVPWYR